MQLFIAFLNVYGPYGYSVTIQFVGVVMLKMCPTCHGVSSWENILESVEAQRTDSGVRGSNKT